MQLRARIKLMSLMALCIASATAMEGEYSSKPQEDKPRGKGICLNCGSPKNHNNSFCSAKCCKDYREQHNH